jgi:uncharacterized iron-regulated protein
MRLALSRRRLVQTAAMALALPALARPVRAAPLAENDIWDPDLGRVILQEELLDRLEAAAEVRLGERHGHAPHQNRAAFLIQSLAARGRYPALALEMLDPAQEAVVAAYRRDRPEYARGLAQALDWPGTGWPDWTYYEPVFDAAFAARLSILAADLPRAERRRIREEGTDERPEDPATAMRWRTAMKRAHCDLLGADELDRLALLQWLRDRNMARVLAANRPALLLAGREHVLPPGAPLPLPEGTDPESLDALAITADGTTALWLTARADSRGLCG